MLLASTPSGQLDPEDLLAIHVNINFGYRPGSSPGLPGFAALHVSKLKFL